MTTKSGLATLGKKTHESTPSSKLSKQKHIVKPESRQLGTKLNSPDAANSVLRKVF